jgi:hypothetical protein
MDVLLLDCVFPEAPRPVYKKAAADGTVSYPCMRRRNPNFCKPLTYPPCLSTLVQTLDLY